MRTFQIKHRDEQAIRLLQITDCHLFSNKTNTLLGVNTYESLHAVIDAIETKKVHFDLMVLSGDLSQDQSIASYQHIALSIAHWQKPCFWLPGNHDDLINMEQGLNSLSFVEHVLMGEVWQMVILNSQIIDEPCGYINDEQFALLENILINNKDRFTLVFLHHHTLPSGSQWLDQHCLQNKEEFWQKLSAFPQVKGVVSGHIHQNFETEYQGCKVLASPSTSIQFLPNSKDFALDNQAPGWREIYLHSDGSIETKIERVESNLFNPDMASTGY